ncbi:MAG: M56 family metallopeptidase, partial [Planctomycetota bacterium]
HIAETVDQFGRAADAPWLTRLDDSLPTVAAYLPWVWVAGAPLTFAWLVCGLGGAARLRRRSKSLVDGPIAATCQQLRRAMRVTDRVTFAVCDSVVQPVLLGVVRPIILLPPAAVTGWSTEELEMVLVHELAHVRRWDNLVNLVQRVIESLLFFHPFVWLVSRQVRRDREECCDAIVVARTERPRAYAELLLTIAAQGQSAPLAASALARHPLARRVRRILKLEDEAMLVSRSLLGTIAITLVIAIGLVLSNPWSSNAESNAATGNDAEAAADDSTAPVDDTTDRVMEEAAVQDPEVSGDLLATNDEAASDEVPDALLAANPEATPAELVASAGDSVAPASGAPTNRPVVDGILASWVDEDGTESYVFRADTSFGQIAKLTDRLQAAGKNVGFSQAKDGRVIVKATKRIRAVQPNPFVASAAPDGGVETRQLDGDASPQQILAAIDRLGARSKRVAITPNEGGGFQLQGFPVDNLRMAPGRRELAYRVPIAMSRQFEIWFAELAYRPGDELHMSPGRDGKHIDFYVLTDIKRHEEILRALAKLSKQEEGDVTGASPTPAGNRPQELPFVSLEEQRAADRAYKLLGVELEPLDDEELAIARQRGFPGGLRLAGIRSGLRLVDSPGFPINAGDLLVGLHVWPTDSLQALQTILSRDDLQQLSPLKFYVL